MTQGSTVTGEYTTILRGAQRPSPISLCDPRADLQSPLARGVFNLPPYSLCRGLLNWLSLLIEVSWYWVVDILP